MSYRITALKPSHLNYQNAIAQKRGTPNFVGPHIITSYTVDGDRRCFPNDRRQLFFVRRCPPCTYPDDVHLDLNAGFEKVINKLAETHGMMDHMLHVIVEEMAKFRNSKDADGQHFLRADVVASRGLLRQLMMMSYVERSGVGFSVRATRFKGNIYLASWQSDKHLEHHNRNCVPDIKRILSYGYKFEQYRQTKCRNKMPDTSGAVNENEEFKCLMESRLDGIRLLYCVELDGIDEDEDVDLDTVDLNTVRFVELKVHLRPTTWFQKRNYRKFKLNNWWAQCFLAGVDQVQVGLRTNEGVVNEINTASIDDFVEESKDLWEPSVCLQFLEDFLNLVRKELTGVDCAQSVYRFDFLPTEDAIHLTTFHGANIYSFLPDWYISAIENNMEV